VAKTLFQPCGVLTLTTDIGHKGPFVATMKGAMLKVFPEARIVDLTHETDAHFPGEAGFWLSRAYRYFPRGTVHVAVVDPGVGTSRDIIAMVLDEHAFLAPDNGLLGPLADRAGARAFVLDLRKPDRFGLGEISATFHGRDILAPIGAQIAAGKLRPEDLGPAAQSLVPAWIEEPVVRGGRVSGVVVTFDNFGNLITNITAQHLAEFERPVIEAGGRVIPLRRTYADVIPGDYLALVNSFDALELARAEQSAAEGLGLGRGAPIVVREA
jgi:S-adenosylmethionine hydrolase